MEGVGQLGGQLRKKEKGGIGMLYRLGLIVVAIIVAIGDFVCVRNGLSMMNENGDAGLLIGLLICIIPLYLTIAVIGAIVNRWYVNSFDDEDQ